MARGWESKSVEDQIQERESRASESSSQQKLTPEELQRRNKREGILMARTRTLTSLQTACGGRHRGHLEQVLADLDKQLAELDGSSR
jgi:Cft2 family RNA processing exonuclease